MITEPLTGARKPEQTDGPLGGLQIANAVNDLAPYVVPRFPTAAARDTAYGDWVATGGVLEDGMVCTLTDSDRVLRHDGSKWVKIAGPREVLISNGNLGNSGSVSVGSSAIVSSGSLTVPVAAKTARVDYVAGLITVSGGQVSLTLAIDGTNVATQTVNAPGGSAVPAPLGADFDIASGTVAWALTLAVNSGSAANLSYSGIRVTI